ncbi:hypothetical protein PISMIDRAFT_122910 [Pisolithus microcarpus 441]|uniref:Unplaced genomic scaffold scaffold_562, whole genome shotgun sequence n=1 Tax=Pisolithus microcarpus 441 TaxID=765257 RepID=A0A0C9XG70_9AGAM|nr:hypothetical protein PISMIDRAFT_122910 [Pisolithus microcarpus 441]
MTLDAVGNLYPPHLHSPNQIDPRIDHALADFTLRQDVYNLSDSNTLERMRQGDHHLEREHNPYFPFIDGDEWELGKFLYTNFTHAQINSFLKLRWVTSKSQTSFRSAQELLSHLDMIPKGPTWHCTRIETTGYVTKELTYLFWRDALEVTREILGNPVFAQHMEYDPYQDQLPVGATIVPIVLASDKAPVTRMTGDLEMHPLFLTIANINSKVRMKATSHAWRCIAYTPTPEFLTNSEFRSVLEARVWHRCVDIVCAGLKLATCTGTFISDLNNATRYCFTPLAAYTADLPEQLMIACVTKSVSPVSIAEKTQFGNAVAYAPHDGEATLRKLHALCQEIDPWRLQVFTPEAKKRNLSGVQLPFWRDWRFSNPSVFLVGELLHYGHKMFFDHPFKWCKELLGHDEIDTRYHTQHKRVGIRHFNGVSQVNQMTGCEHRDLQRTIVATIAGLAEPDFLCTICAIVDFLYRAQSPTFTSSSICAMEELLQEFHAHKGAILRTGMWRGKSKEIAHFQIPKLKLLHSFSRSIRNVSSLIQYSADVSEWLLITHCKDPFTHTNRQRNGFTEQIILLLDREESIRLFNLYSLLLERDVSFTNIPSGSDDPHYVDPTLDWVQHVAPEEVNHFHGPRTFRNHFLKGIISKDTTSAFHVTVMPEFAEKSPKYVATAYNLPDFPTLLQNYIDGVPGDHSYIHWRLLKGWTKFRLQLRSYLDPSDIIPSQQVQALPPSAEHPFGKCDTVLVHYTPPFGMPSEHFAPSAVMPLILFFSSCRCSSSGYIHIHSKRFTSRCRLFCSVDPRPIFHFYRDTSRPAGYSKDKT